MPDQARALGEARHQGARRNGKQRREFRARAHAREAIQSLGLYLLEYICRIVVSTALVSFPMRDGPRLHALEPAVGRWRCSTVAKKRRGTFEVRGRPIGE